MNRIAKDRLMSASSITSLSSYQSDEQFDDEIESPINRNRPKSASVKHLRKRNAKKLMKKFVENDIDENDIIGKMQMAQQAINTHRECIQELLQTTAHSPNSMTKVKYSSAAAKGDENPAKPNETMNQYSKMPNVTTRRVVFVNLDEDS